MTSKRLSVAIAAYVVLAVIAMIGLNGDVKTGTLIVLGGLAVKTLPSRQPNLLPINKVPSFKSQTETRIPFWNPKMVPKTPAGSFIVV